MLDAKFESQRSIIISLSGKLEQAFILEQKTLDRLKIESIYSDLTAEGLDCEGVLEKIFDLLLITICTYANSIELLHKYHCGMRDRI